MNENENKKNTIEYKQFMHDVANAYSCNNCPEKLNTTVDANLYPCNKSYCYIDCYCNY